MRKKTDYIVVHCSATTPDMDIGVEEIDQWHKDRGWSGVGYHDVIRRNGVPEEGRHVNAVGAHVKGYNSISVGVCLVGGIDDNGRPQDNFTPEQYKTLTRLLRFYRALFPEAAIVGHNQLNPHKACPSFNVTSFVANSGLY